MKSKILQLTFDCQTKVYFSQNRKIVEVLLFSLILLKLQEEMRLACNEAIVLTNGDMTSVLAMIVEVLLPQVRALIKMYIVYH